MPATHKILEPTITDNGQLPSVRQMIKIVSVTGKDQSRIHWSDHHIAGVLGAISVRLPACLPVLLP